MTRAETEALLAKGITKDQAVKLLHSNIEKATQDARKLVVTFDKLSENRQNVLIDMAFNLGRSRLSQFKNTIRLINEGKFDLASQNMLKSLWAKQVKGRAVRLSIMMRDDVAYDKATKRMKR
jgi:lysozyme